MLLLCSATKFALIMSARDFASETDVVCSMLKMNSSRSSNAICDATSWMKRQQRLSSQPWIETTYGWNAVWCLLHAS